MLNSLVSQTARQWKLTGITNGAGQCECCSRRLTQRVFQVAHPDGTVVQLGRRCAAKATGYAVSAIERQLRVALRVAEVRRREAIIRAAYPELGEAYDATQQTGRWTGEAELFSTAATEDGWWGDRNRTAFPTWQAYVTHYSREGAR